MIVKFLTIEDFDALIFLLDHAFYCDSVEREKARIVDVREILEEKNNGKFIGLFDDNNKLVSALQIYFFKLNFRGEMVDFGGLGRVVTDLIYKQNGYARITIDYALDYLKKNNYCFSGLLPFNIEYYQRYGFGYGTENHVFSIRPSSFRKGNTNNLHHSSLSDFSRFEKYYQSCVQSIHGMLQNTKYDSKRLMESKNIIGYEENGEICGYFCYFIDKSLQASEMTYDLVVTEMFYSKPEVIAAFSAFFFSQRYQFDRIRLYSTQSNLYFISQNSDNGEKEFFPGGIKKYSHHFGGILYKILDIKKYVEKYIFPHIDDEYHFVLKLSLLKYDGSLLEKWYIHFGEDQYILNENYKNSMVDCNLSISLSDFISWSFGVVSLEELIEMCLASLDNQNYQGLLQKIFGYEKKPRCITYF